MSTGSSPPASPTWWGSGLRRGQSLVEFALILPLLLLASVGGLFMGLLILDRMTLQPIAWEGARAAAAALSDVDRCPATLAAVQAVSGRVYADCDDTHNAAGSSLLLEVDPLTEVPRAVKVTLTDRLAAPPLISFATDGTVRVRAGAVIEPLP